MKRSLNSLIGYTIGGTDGEVGKVKEFYFDDDTWTIHYLIVETGDWLSSRKVLISPHSISTPDWEKRIFPTPLTKEQIKNSPDIDTEMPVSREQQVELQEYYLQSGYWGGNFYAGGMYQPIHQALEYDEGSLATEKLNENRHLRSSLKVTGNSIKATDGEIGKVEDFLIHDGTWKIDFIVIDTGHWFPGKKVLISPKWIKEINWETSTVTINTSIIKVKNSPEYNADQPLHEDYEVKLHNYYSEFVTNIQ